MAGGGDGDFNRWLLYAFTLVVLEEKRCSVQLLCNGGDPCPESTDTVARPNVIDRQRKDLNVERRQVTIERQHAPLRLPSMQR